MNEFYCRTRILFGPGSVSALGTFGAKRLFLVTDAACADNGMASMIVQLAGAQQAEVFDRVPPEPTVALAAEGTARMKQFRPDLLAALGDRGAMDCAKTMACFAQGTFPLVTVPTVPGSGAETVSFALLTHGQATYPLVDSRLQPDIAILDSDLLSNTPRGKLAEAGFDLIALALEAWVGSGANPISDLWAREAFSAAFAGLPAAFAGQSHARQRVQLASAMAGLAASHAGLGLCHALAHSLGSRFRIPLGHLNAVLLPAVLECNAYAAQPRYAQLARAAGMGGSSDSGAMRNLVSGILRLRRELELPQTLAQAGIPPRELRANLRAIAESVLQDPWAASNPIPAEEYLIRRILEEAAGRIA